MITYKIRFLKKIRNTSTFCILCGYPLLSVAIIVFSVFSIS